MAVKKMKKSFRKLLGDRKGTAEIVGSVMFLVILLFVFTNVYLWHDSASREMNGVRAEKMNTPISIEAPEVGGADLVVTNKGGFEVGLSRLWLINSTSGDHYYADLEPFKVHVAAGVEFPLVFTDGPAVFNVDGSVSAVWNEDGYVIVYYPNDQVAVCKILTTLGNMAACTYEP